MLSRVQDRQLSSFTRHVLPYSPFYRLALKEWPVVRGVQDIGELPFTEKADVAPTNESPQRSRQFLLQPNEALFRQHAPFSWKKLFAQSRFLSDLEYQYAPVHVHFTTGRTALPTPFFQTRQDMDTLRETGRRMLAIGGLSRTTRLLNAFPFAPHLAFWQTALASEAAGVFALHTGGGRVLGTERIIEMAKRFESTALVGMPSYVHHVLSAAVEGSVKLPALDTLILGGEAVTDRLRSSLKDLAAKLDAKVRVLSTYGLTEGRCAWMECAEGSGYHLYPDLEVIEVVGKDGKHVGATEAGEIVCTPIGWRGSVVVRYKTGDVGRLFVGKCPSCGRTVPRISSDISRTSETRMLRTKVKGQLVDFEGLADVLRGLPVREWQAVIRRRGKGTFGLDELVLRIAVQKGASTAKVSGKVVASVRDAMDVTPKVVIVQYQRLVQDLGVERELKQRRVIDERAA